MLYFLLRIKKIFKPTVKQKDIRRLGEAVCEYYDKNPVPDSDPDLEKAVDYVKKNGVKIFPAPFWDKYTDMDVEVFEDDSCGLRYVMHHGHRLYFVKSWPVKRIRNTYSGLLREQDRDSPHCYQTAGFSIKEGDTLFDIGCAEAMLSLTAAEKARAIYLFEGDRRWIEPLRRTFEPWKDKVTIVNKFVSDKDTANSVTIGKIIGKDGITGPLFLKLDVEGAEKDVIAGMSDVLQTYPDHINSVVCTYHNHDDYAELSSLMRSKGFDISTSDGYMLFIYDHKKLRPPYFRKGVIYCTREPLRK